MTKQELEQDITEAHALLYLARKYLTELGSVDRMLLLTGIDEYERRRGGQKGVAHAMTVTSETSSEVSRGILKIGPVEVEIVQLHDGRRLVAPDGVAALFAWMAHVPIDDDDPGAEVSGDGPG